MKFICRFEVVRVLNGSKPFCCSIPDSNQKSAWNLLYEIVFTICFIDNQHAEVLRSESAVNPDSFNYNYETSNGIYAKSAGQLKAFGTEHAITHQGDFSYTDATGTKYTVNYVADENGYQPTGDHLPVAPAVPAAIARALEWIAAHPSPESKKGF